MAVLPETAMTEAALNVLVMNVAHLLRMLLRFWGWAIGRRFTLLRYICIAI